VAATPGIRLTGQWVAEAMSAAIVSGEATREFSGVSIDSRTLTAGQLFVAIRGERFDGAEFVGQALSAGAAGVVVQRGRGVGLRGSGPAVVMEADGPIEALQALAQRVRRESGAKVVAVTGSAGKTTTKEIAAEFLGAVYRVIRNKGNFNNHIGLPLSLIELRQRPEIAVVELGMNHAREISTLVRIAEPDVRVWTNVGEAHLEFFGSLDAIADAKSEILERATASTVLVANADDQRVMARVTSFPGRVLTFGIERSAAIHAASVVDRGIDGTTARSVAEILPTCLPGPPWRLPLTCRSMPSLFAPASCGRRPTEARSCAWPTASR
jgi:UDP-N-acetylmuramoyl-tripeptide--D-alanyl-D-alanine ligase